MNFAKMNGDFGENDLLVLVGRKRKPFRSTQVSGNYLGLGFEKQEAGPIKQLHQVPG